MKAHPIPDSPVSQRQSALVIAIDGPAGAGKSTVARLLAARLGYLYLDTGALYRAIAWKARERGLAATDEVALARMLAETSLEVRHEGGVMHVIVDGRDVNGELRAPDISALASAVSSLPAVRDWLLPVQRRIGERGAVVAEGRDIGTRVFPSADLKFFLDANMEVRAQRRYRELRAAGRGVSLEETQEDLRMRDHRDQTRATAPLQRATDAVTIDTSDVNAEKVVDHMLEAIAAKR